MSNDANQNSRRTPGGKGFPGEHALRADVKAYLDGELSPPRRWLLRWHVAQCDACREEMKWLQRLGEDMRDLEKATPRPELRARILANLPPAPPRPMTASRRAPIIAQHPGFPRLAMASVLFALALSGVLASHLFSNTHSSPTQAKLPTATAQKAPGAAQQVATAHTQRDVAPSTGVRQKAQPLLVDLKDYTDPISQEAERLMRQREVRDAEARERKRQQERGANLVFHQDAVPDAATIEEKPPLRLTLETQDGITSRSSLADLAHKLGGKAFDAKPSDPTTGDTKGNMPVIALHIPTENVSALLAGMSQVGQVVSSVPIPDRTLSRPPIATPQIPATKATDKPKLATGASPASDVPEKPSRFHSMASQHVVLDTSSAKKLDEAKKPTWVTIFVALNAPVSR